MSKHIKRFSTYDEYLDYVTDSSFEPPLVSVCDEETEDNGGYPSSNFTISTDITIDNPYNYTGNIYVTNEHEVLYTYSIGTPLQASNTSHILGERQYFIDSIPYHKDLYYCWTIWALGSGTACTLRSYDIYGNESYPDINVNGYISEKLFWNDYCESNSINYWSCPYDITGYPGNYNCPTITTQAYENDSWTNAYSYNPSWGINTGDTVVVPICYGVKMVPGAKINITFMTPK